MLGFAQHSTAQHSTAQHSTAQHSTAQHSNKSVFLLSVLSRQSKVFPRRSFTTSPLTTPSAFGVTSPCRLRRHPPHGADLYPQIVW